MREGEKLRQLRLGRNIVLLLPDSNGTMEMKAGQRDELVPHFWIGDLFSAKEAEELRENHISHVLTVAKELGELKDFDFSVRLLRV